MTNPNPVISYVQTLFARGIETYNRETKTANNVGGAQVFQLARWKSADSPVFFNNEAFGRVLREIGATLYSLNRIRVDADGKPIKVPGTTKNQRANSGLMLYTQYGEDGAVARQVASRILEACPELTGYVSAVVDILDQAPELQNLERTRIGISGDDQEVFMNPRKCVILNVTSGSRGSSQYWSYSQKGAKTRESIDSLTKVTDDISDIV